MDRWVDKLAINLSIYQSKRKVIKYGNSFADYELYCG